jgi:hypothetical protein
MDKSKKKCMQNHIYSANHTVNVHKNENQQYNFKDLFPVAIYTLKFFLATIKSVVTKYMYVVRETLFGSTIVGIVPIYNTSVHKINTILRK